MFGGCACVCACLCACGVCACVCVCVYVSFCFGEAVRDAAGFDGQCGEQDGGTVNICKPHALYGCQVSKSLASRLKCVFVF